jgi:hypothetical protein
MHIVKWLVHTSFAVLSDMKSHTGAATRLGKGAIHGASTKQKLNATSSTESELVGVNDVMPQALWTRYFLEEQGYDVKDSIIYQDNQSSMLLEKHGRASSSKRTQHISIRYFFVTNRIASSEVSVEYCPTKTMIADFFTKPLEGIQFQTFMNVNPSPTSLQDQRSVLGNEKDLDGRKTDVVAPSREPPTNSGPRREPPNSGDSRMDEQGWTKVKGR